jgi:tRNA pseudouridine55 synthase
MSQLLGLLPIDKTPGWTSHDVIAYTRGILSSYEFSRIGHCGTLDPMASGLLLVLIGREATKKQPEFLGLDKVYKAQVKLGTLTDSWDITGKVLKEEPCPKITLAQVKEALKSMTGVIKHPIPFYSAKKVKGQAMYDHARKGVNIKKDSVVEIYKYSKISLKNDIIEFEVFCSSGTYVRSLAFMLGEKLGTVATLSALRRLKIGPYNVKKALPLDVLRKSAPEDIAKWVKSL